MTVDAQTAGEAPARLALGLAAVTAINLPAGSIYAFSVFLKPLEAELAASRSELAIVFAVAALCFTAGLNLGPRLFDRLGAATVMVLATALMAGGTLLASTARDVATLAIGCGALFGIGGGMGFISSQQGINSMATRRRGLVNGYVVSLLPLGAMIAAPLIGWGIAALGVRATLTAEAAAMVACGGLAAVLARASGMRLTETRGPRTSVTAPAAPIGAAVTFWKMFTVFFLAASAGLMVLGQAAGIVLAYGGSASLAVGATTVVTATVAAGRLAGGWLVDRFNVPSVMLTAQLVALAGAGAATLWPSAPVAVGALVAIGGGYGLISGSTAGGVAMYWQPAVYGRVASRLYIAWCAAAIALPVLAARLFDLTGGYRAALIIAGAASLLSSLTATTLPRSISVTTA